ncbi:MAG: hypothetical protein WBV81_15365 [Ignavibacteriaceae bacterium]
MQIFDNSVKAESFLYDKNIGGMDNILSDFFRLCFMHRILTFSAVSEVPPFGKWKNMKVRT